MRATRWLAPLMASVAWIDCANAQDQVDEPGRAIYYQRCAGCHENPSTRAPSLQSLRQMNRETISYALTQGYMQQQASNVPPKDLSMLIAFLAASGTHNDDWIAATQCKDVRKQIDLTVEPTVASFGFDLRNSRRLTAKQAGLSTADMSNLELTWAMGFPQTPTMRSQPVIVGATIFIATTDSARLYALDTDTACVKWVYKSEVPLRSSLSFSKLFKRKQHVLVFGDAAGFVQAIDAQTGKLVWKSDVKLDPRDRVTGAPIIYRDRIYTPLSSIEVNYAPNDKYECCKSHGAVIALDLATGKQLWVMHTMEAATPRGKNRIGTQQWGPSGAPIWSTPAIDAKRNVLYVGTGENFSLPATNTSDSLLAIDLDSGAIRWKFQGFKNDVWNTSCGQKGANCDFGEQSVILDFDFGASALLAKRANGSDVLLVGHKSGTVWAFDPDKNGAIVWQHRFGKGSAAGGIHWGLTYDGTRVFAPLNDPIGPGRDDLYGPGLHALDIETGKVLWDFDTKPNCEGDRRKRASNCDRRIGLSAAPLLIDGAVVTGSTDGYLRIFDAVTGKILFTYDTAHDYKTVNGVPGTGGGIDNAPFVAANGTLFVQSGYSRFGHPPGNVLLAFRPHKAK